MKLWDGLRFDDSWRNLGNEIRLVHVPSDVKSAEALIESIGRAIGTHYEFGRNWNAFEDVLGDLRWTNSKSVALIHHALPKLSQLNLSQYLDVLRTVFREGLARGNADVFAYFPEACRLEIEQLPDGG